MLLPLHLNGLNLDSGTAVAVIAGSFTEAQVVTGGNTIVITLTNDTWVAAGATFNAQRQNIIDGITSAQTELLGWNNVVRDNEVVGAVVRTSDTVVTVTFTAAPTYDITADETITVTVPATALTAAGELTGTPTVSVTATVEDTATGGISKKRRGVFPKYLVEVDGEFFDASNVALIRELLAEAELQAQISAQHDVVNKPVTNTKIRIKPPKIAVKARNGEAVADTIRQEVASTQRKINKIYRKAHEEAEQIRETAKLIKKAIKRQEEQDEEDILMLLL